MRACARPGPGINQFSIKRKPPSLPAPRTTDISARSRRENAVRRASAGSLARNASALATNERRAGARVGYPNRVPLCRDAVDSVSRLRCPVYLSSFIFFSSIDRHFRHRSCIGETTRVVCAFPICPIPSTPTYPKPRYLARKHD